MLLHLVLICGCVDVAVIVGGSEDSICSYTWCYPMTVQHRMMNQLYLTTTRSHNSSLEWMLLHTYNNFIAYVVIDVQKVAKEQ